ncbi:MAG: ribosome maturation factor RimM [Pseudomonadota bacterium]|nr:ribosome maturation factor RimM [Pseudomonadota bacterium]
MAHDASATWPDDALEVGRIGEAWGLKGGFRVLAYADPPQALLAASCWHLRPAEDARRPRAAAALPAMLEIASVRASGDGLVASSPAVADRSAAEALRGARIFIARSQFPAPASDEFYWADLIGLGVVNREGIALGNVVGLIDTGPQSVLRVAAKAADAAEVLIPFVSAYVDSVDLAARRIVVDWGLDY